MDAEERKLQIKLAQLNAKIQTGLAWTFGALAAGITLLALVYQVEKEYYTVTIATWVATLVCMFVMFG